MGASRNWLLCMTLLQQRMHSARATDCLVSSCCLSTPVSTTSGECSRCPLRWSRAAARSSAGHVTTSTSGPGVPGASLSILPPAHSMMLRRVAGAGSTPGVTNTEMPCRKRAWLLPA